MFRKPRDNSSPSIETPTKPSTGRPPTPPGSSRPIPSSTMTTGDSTKPLTPRPNSKSNVTISSKASVKKLPFSKTPRKPNTSILSFFRKVDSPFKDDSIFLSQGSQANNIPSRLRAPSAEFLEGALEDMDNDQDATRFNEAAGPVKRRKTSNEILQNGVNSDKEGATADDNKGSTTIVSPKTPISLSKSKTSRKPRRNGPFLSDSESDHDVNEDSGMVGPLNTVEESFSDLDDMAHMKWLNNKNVDKVLVDSPTQAVEPIEISRKRVPVAEAQARWEALQPRSREPNNEEEAEQSSGSEYGNVKKHVPKVLAQKKDTPRVPILKKEATSVDDWGQFEDLENFPDDDSGDGEEYVERKWMEEQATLEAIEQGLYDEPFNGFDYDPVDEKKFEEGVTPACPICSTSLGGITPDDATRHVNGCLDGNPIPLPSPVKEEPWEPKEVKIMPPAASSRFARKAAVARPGQANPFELGSGSTKGLSTAFTAIMSGKAEDAAWASAAAAENASRGKPAYQRTCPFYKIMPGFFICVDAFRYGAVQGCNAYFLSHFHSDHYVGLTSTWCHGPIYCSKVTANLVKQQLRVDPKWVVPLDFEVKSEVPGTQGVQITMIPANHCPGSSLFLFEKVIGKGANPKVQRILHCGDFRACPAHIAHPQLMPDLVDSITGKMKQQKIDVCYLDTTYLNPRYAFPSQEEVIKACADMCVSLKKERAEESDAWEVAKRQRAGAGMANFVSNSSSTIKPEDNSIAMEIGNTKPRGRLLVVCGTYSIGKERICMGIAKALDCKIWAPPGKMRICAALEDPELMSRMTDDPKEAQIHMQMLMEIRAETLQDYLNSYKPHFSRIVGFRPSGWNYRPPNSRFTDSPSISTILYSTNWRSTYNMSELIPQRGSTREASCFGVPYSEHSSFRELTMFICALRIEKVVPTVNVGSAAGRAKMKSWIEKWLAERRKGGVIRIGTGEGEVRW